MATSDLQVAPIDGLDRPSQNLGTTHSSGVPGRIFLAFQTLCARDTSGPTTLCELVLLRRKAVSKATRVRVRLPPFCPPLPLVHPLPFELNSATTGEGDDEGSREPLRPNRHPLSAQMRAQPRLSTPGQARRVGPPAPHTLERIHFAIASHLIRCTVTLQGDKEAQGSFAQGLEKHSLQGQADGCSATPLTPAVMRAAAVCNRVCGQNVFSPACIHKSLSPCPGSWHPEGCSQLPC